MEKERVMFYIDGFNLYFGLSEAYGHDYKWLDVYKLAGQLLKDDQKLEAVKFFTSRVRNNHEKERRQRTYISALETTPIEIIYGHYQANTLTCRRCANVWRSDNEKMTDVNIATSILVDAINNKYDVAILVSGDSDLVPPVLAIHKNFSKKRVVIAFPPKRAHVQLQTAAKGHFVIGKKKLRDCQFPPEIPLVNGYNLQKPSEWV